MAINRVLGKRRRPTGGWTPAKRGRKGFRRTKRRRQGSVYTKIMKQPVPDRMFTKMNYSEVLILNLNFLTLGYHVYRSSLFDPDYSSTGHQPLWRDQYALMYNKYRVLGIKYKLALLNTSSNSMVSGGVKYSNDYTVEASLNTLRERRNVHKLVVGPQGSKATFVKGYMPVGKPHGLTKKNVIEDEDFIALMGDNPAKLSYLHIYLSSTDLSGAVVNVQADLTYYVELMERTSVSGS